MTERRSPSAAHTPLSPDEIVRRSFSSAFRGLDPTEVRDFLVRLSDQLRVAASREEELLERIADLEEKLAQPPVIDDAMVAAHLGEETTQIVKSAKEAAAEIRSKAELELKSATESADEIRAQLRAEADDYAKYVREAAEHDSEAMLIAAREHAQEMLNSARGSGRSVLEQAQDLRARVLEDLVKRRRLAYAQVEQLLVGRDHLLEAVQLVRSNLDDMTNALQRAESDARTAAEAARDRMLDEETEQQTAEEFEAAVADVTAEPILEKEVVPEFVAEDELISEDRRSNSLMIVRRKRRSGGAPVAKVNTNGNGNGVSSVKPNIEISATQFGDENEGVTILPRDNGTQSTENEDQIVDLREFDTSNDQEIVEEEEDVDSLFAQMRADREKAVHEAERILTGQRHASEHAEAVVIESSSDVEQIDDEMALEVNEISERDILISEAFIRRDHALESLVTRFGKQLKRVMQNEQNEVLDAIRNQKGRPTPEALPSDDVQLKIYSEALSEVISDAVIAGLNELESGVSADVVRHSVTDMTQLITSEFLAPLRRKLSQAIVTVPANTEDVERGVLDAVGAVYREAKIQRADVLARDVLTAAYTRGVFSGADKDSQFVWGVDENGQHCSDCVDNATAEASAAGMEFPSGQQLPPAHPGCRCLIVRV